MLPGIAIRKGFLALDVILAALVVGIGGILVQRVSERQAQVAAIDNGPMEAPSLDFYKVKHRGAYQPILSSGIFGEAASAKEPEKPAEPPKEETLTDLALTLYGVTMAGTKDPLATAMIQVAEGRAVPITTTFYIGDPVVPNVFLNEVRAREVVLDNRNKNELQVLKLEEELGQQQVANNRTTVTQRPSTPNHVRLDRSEFIRDLQVNYTDLITKVKPRYVKDARGRVTGITADNISNIPLARKLNLQDGDILQTINNEPVDSEEKIIEIINKYRNARSFRMGIMRNGRPTMLTYSLEN